MDSIKLNDKKAIPPLGFGVFMVPDDGTCEKAVSGALAAGYRLIDTAAAYMNEQGVGRAIRHSGIDREEVYVTSKLWIQDYGYKAAKKGIDRSLENLGLDYIDLYLIHQPYGDVAGAWKAMEEAVQEGKLRSIGVSNHTVRLLGEILPKMEILPAVNQVECNPYCQQRELRKYMARYGIRTEAWYPLGHGDKKMMTDPVLTALAEKYGKDVGQVILRWHLQEGIIPLPKATSDSHIRGNIDIFDFALSDADMAAIAALDTGKGTHDPEDPANAQRLSAFRIHD